MMIDTLHYYPRHIAEIKEFIRLTAGVDSELYQAWDAVDHITKNMYLDTMDAEACLRWEHFLGIVANPMDTLDDRRGRIKGYFASNLPYTVRKLREVLETMCGPDGYELVVDPNAGTVDIFIMLSNARLVDNTHDVIRKMAPADMIVHTRIIYNTHGIFRGYTHAELRSYTHAQLRSDQIFQRNHNRHVTLGKHTHAELAALTHKELLEERL